MIWRAATLIRLAAASGLIASPAVVALTASLAGCGPEEGHAPPRIAISRGVRVDAVDGFEAVPPGDWRLLSFGGDTRLDLTTGGARYLIHHPFDDDGRLPPYGEVVIAPEDGRLSNLYRGAYRPAYLADGGFVGTHWMRLGFIQDLERAPLGQRYLYTEDFTGVRLMLAREQERIYTGEAIEWTLAVDLAVGAFYGSFTGLISAEWPTPSDEAHLVSMTFVGALEESEPCVWHTPLSRVADAVGVEHETWAMPDDAPEARAACAAARAAIAAAPDDPDGPAPPWRLSLTREEADSDVIARCPGGPCNFD